MVQFSSATRSSTLDSASPVHYYSALYKLSGRYKAAADALSEQAKARQQKQKAAADALSELLAEAVDTVWATSRSDRQIILKASQPVRLGVRPEPRWPGSIIAVRLWRH